MIDPAAALLSGVARLLDAEGEVDLGRLLGSGRVEVIEPPEVWAMGARQVHAHRVALLLPAREHAQLAATAGGFEAIKRAFGRAMRTADTELADLHLELMLPVIERSFRSAYRSPPSPAPRERPSVEAILAGAAALLDAMDLGAAATVVRRATLETALVPGTATPLCRCVVHLAPADLAAALEDAGLGQEIRRAVQAAAARAEEAVTVELALDLPRA